MTGRTRTVGLIGVGLVGTAAAEQLLGAGYRVVGFDIRPERRAQLRALGGESATDAAAVAMACDRLLLSLPTSTIAATVLDEVLPCLAHGALVIDTTTGAPEDAIRCAERLGEAGVEYVDATIGGSSQQIRTREAIILCGGNASGYTRSLELLKLCCRTAYHVGPAGSGARLKLVLNLVLGLNRAVLAEGLEFARACGIDPELALAVLRAGPAYSRVMDTKGERMLRDEFEPEARLSQHLKDVRLILAEGEAAGASLPLSTIHRELLEAAEAAGYGGADNSAIIKSFQKDVCR